MSPGSGDKDDGKAQGNSMPCCRSCSASSKPSGPMV